MKLLISNQYGAIVMALLPFVYGMLLASPVWAHFFFAFSLVQHVFAELPNAESL